MKIYYSIILIIAIFLSCQFKETKILKPEHFLNTREMAEILIDAHVVESMMVDNKIYGDSLNQLTVDYYNAIFEKYGIDKNIFDENMDYYIKNPDKLNKVYELVQSNFEKSIESIE